MRTEVATVVMPSVYGNADEAAAHSLLGLGRRSFYPDPILSFLLNTGAAAEAEAHTYGHEQQDDAEYGEQVDAVVCEGIGKLIIGVFGAVVPIYRDTNGRHCDEWMVAVATIAAVVAGDKMLCLIFPQMSSSALPTMSPNALFALRHNVAVACW